MLVNALLPTPALWPLYLGAGGIAALDGLQRPSLNALIPRLMNRGEIPAANAIQGLRWQIGSIAGPALGGLLVTQVGLAVAYTVDVATFAVSIVLLVLLRPVPPPKGAERPSIAGIMRGARYAFSRQELLGTYLVDIAAMFLAMPIALFRQTIWNQTIPDHFRGRLAGIELLSFSIGPTLGQLRAGGMAAAIGLRGAMATGGLLCFGAVGLLAAVLPRLTAYDERTSPHGQPSPPMSADAPIRTLPGDPR